jgi:hypothetical protein
MRHVIFVVTPASLMLTVIGPAVARTASPTVKKPPRILNLFPAAGVQQSVLPLALSATVTNFVGVR